MPNREPIDDLTDRVVTLEDGQKSLRESNARLEDGQRKVEAHLIRQDDSILRLSTGVEKMGSQVAGIVDIWHGQGEQRGMRDMMIEIREGVADRKAFRLNLWPLVISTVIGVVLSSVLGAIWFMAMVTLKLKTP